MTEKLIGVTSRYRLLFISVVITGLLIPGFRLFGERDFSGLASETAEAILQYLSEQRNVTAAVTRFENTAGVSDLAAQKFYQLFVSRIETGDTVGFADIMINFQDGRGVFNLNRLHGVNYSIYIKLTRSQSRIGAGVAVFSKRLDKTVFIKYLESSFTPGERDMFETVSYGFESSGFSRVIEMDADPGLLDLKSLVDSGGRQVFLYYYPERIDGYTLNGRSLTRLFSHPLKWESPYYPVQFPEGKMTVFKGRDRQYVSVGGNFTAGARLFVFDGIGLTGIMTLNFLPFRHIELNGGFYLAGARYVVGKNFFKNQLVLVPVIAGEVSSGDELIKEVPSFFALDFSLTNPTSSLNSVHLVKTDYHYIYMADNFEQLPVEDDGLRGASLCAMGDRWLAVSAYTETDDSLYFYNIEDGNRRLAYESKLNGQVVFISEGTWKAARGFWVYLKSNGAQTSKGMPKNSGYKLQFWSRKDKS